MRNVACAACEAQTPMNNAFVVGGQTMCTACAEQFVASRPGGKVPKGSISRLVDPTLCGKCKADNGPEDLGTVAGVHLCASCTAFYRNRPFPTWLRWSFVGFVCVAGFAFAYNWRFFIGYIELRRGNRDLRQGQVDEAEVLLASAAQHLPEFPELSVIPNLIKAGELAQQDKDEEALRLIEDAKHKAPPELASTVLESEANAKIGIAFHRKDYDEFLRLAQQYAKDYPTNSQWVAQVASAYACKYAVTGDPAMRQGALDGLEQARKLKGPNNPDFDEYENRIQHRLATRTILTRAQFKEKYPNGWKGN